MNEGNPEPLVEEVAEEHVEHSEDSSDDNDSSYDSTQKTVPLSKYQKLKKRRQELERENEELRNSRSKPSSEDDEYAMYESATKKDLGLNKKETLREVREEYWAEKNPEKSDYVTKHLTEFLKQRPNLVTALKDSPNRIAEAYELMSALHKTKPVKSNAVSKAPLSPSTVPKGSGVNQVADVMDMTDEEFRAWRKSQKGRR